MAKNSVTFGTGEKDDPWLLKTPSLNSEYQAWRDETLDPPALVVQVGTTKLSYRLRCIEDLHAMLVAHGDWMLLGNADEQKDAKPDSVEAWARDMAWQWRQTLQAYGSRPGVCSAPLGSRARGKAHGQSQGPDRGHAAWRTPSGG